MRIPYVSLLAAGALALGGCAYGDLGLGYGSLYGYGYDSPYYGYGGPTISIGYGSGYGYGYGSPYYGGFGSPYYGGFGSPYYGWYNDYYYPGSGYYVYDRYRRPYRMNSTQRSYWTQRSHQNTTRQMNWSGFSRNSRSSYEVDRVRHRDRDRDRDRDRRESRDD